MENSGDHDEAPNRVTGRYGTVAGGAGNQAGEDTLTTVGGAPYGTVGGGHRNVASGTYATVGGGNENIASGRSSVVAGGGPNFATNTHSTIGGGALNVASGQNSTIPGGTFNTASGDTSFAAGNGAKAIHSLSFVWNGHWNHDTYSQAAGDFVVYAPSRVRLFAGTYGSGGCEIGTNDVGGNLTCQGVITATSFVPPSDRALKSDVMPADVADVLARVVAMPIAEWSYMATPNVRHMGPMGQDFHAAFGLGATDKGIATVDADGVALAAIQGLHAKMESIVAAKDAEITALKREMVDLRASQRKEIVELRHAVDVLMALTSADARVAQSR